MKIYLANLLTGSRILGSLLLLLCPVYSMHFFTLYLLCGFTDMIDGTVARKCNAVTEFGSRLDSAADLLFCAVAFWKLLPMITLPRWLWIWIGIIAIFRGIHLIWGAIRRKKLTIRHTPLNKLTGFLLFLLPLTISWIEPSCTVAIAWFIASAAALQEFFESM